MANWVKRRVSRDGSLQARALLSLWIRSGMRARFWFYWEGYGKNRAGEQGALRRFDGRGCGKGSRVTRARRRGMFAISDTQTERSVIFRPHLELSRVRRQKICTPGSGITLLFFPEAPLKHFTSPRHSCSCALRLSAMLECKPSQSEVQTLKMKA